VEIRRVVPDDRDTLLAWVDVVNAVRRADLPWVPLLTEHEAYGELTYGWDLEPDRAWLGTLDGVPVAAGGYEWSDRDNVDVAWLDVKTHPDQRRRGLGTLFFDHLVADAAADGRTSLGMSCWDTPDDPEAFGRALGFERRAVGVHRRQHLAEVDREVVAELLADAEARAADYELLRLPARSTDEELEALAVLTAAINDAPKEGLEIEDEVFDAARIRDYETAQHERGNLLHRLVVRHRGSGELAGQTLVAVDGERPHLAEQHDTSVVAGHRGHRLGVLLKTEMLRWLAETQPQVREIDTWNAESNAFMIGVNDLLGYRVVGRAYDLQRPEATTGAQTT
jgi:GNAT superfamily N-acetyltransferase